MMFILNIYNNIRKYSRLAASMRDAYKDHFTSSIGEISWQYSYVRRNRYNCIYLSTSIISTHVKFTISTCYIIFSLRTTSNIINNRYTFCTPLQICIMQSNFTQN